MFQVLANGERAGPGALHASGAHELLQGGPGALLAVSRRVAGGCVWGMPGERGRIFFFNL